MIGTSVLILLGLSATSSAFLLEGLGLGGLGGGPRQCCCQPPPPPPPCGGGGYEAPPPPPPPPYATGPSYAGAYGPYKARSKKSVDLKASSGDLFCNSVEVRDVIKKGMTEDEKASREAITTLLKAELGREYVVICSKQHFDYLASSDSEFCSVTNDAGLTCSSFVF
uniref:Ground-like domain-containing protein n=1 Tax=Caenorhabditis japonica TaxID=281687 RepID=A0A8R1HVK3_CAEJA